MSIRLAKLRRLALSLTLAAAGLLSGCAQIAPGSHISAPPTPAQAVPPATALAQAPATRTLEGRVVGVADGDTITVLGAGDRQTRVRLQGIDAPESRQAFGQVSKRNLSDLVFDRQVVVE
jgi:endonuclease YncB( thermonuclease family)